MRNYLFTFFLLCFCFLMAAPEPLLRQAENAYDQKNYQEAISSYEKLVQEGYRSFQLYFNLGNAYYRANKLGKAIYNYELARKLSPTDEDISINLSIAQAKTIDKIDSRENFFISAVKTGLLTSLSTTSWAWLSIFFIVLSCCSFYFFRISTQSIIRRLTFIVCLLAGLFFLLTYFLGYSALKAKNGNKFAIILAAESRILNEPTANGKFKFSLHEGTKIHVIETNGDWVLIKLDNGNEGWLQSKDVGVI